MMQREPDTAGPHNPAGFDDVFASSLASMAPVGHSAPVLADRIRRATAVLAAAPDLIADEASKRQARDVATANREAWAILTEDITPPSRRQAKENGDGE